MIDIDRFEIHPWTIVGIDNHGEQMVEQCDVDSDQIDGWGVYAHLMPYMVNGHEIGGLTWLIDLETQQQAEQVMGLLMWLKVKQIPSMKESNEETI